MAVDDSSLARDGGRFETRYSDEQLLGGVRLVLERELRLARGTHVGQRPFDRAANDVEDLPDFPSARQIATRLKRSWADVVQIAWETQGMPSYERAAMSARRAPEADELEDRDTVFALQAVGRHLDAATLTPASYTGGVESLLAHARREGTSAYWESVLPTAHQIERANGTWDVALAKAGLEPRPGSKIGPRVKGRIDYARRTMGLDGAGRVEAITGNGAPEARSAEAETPAAEPARTTKRTAVDAPAATTVEPSAVPAEQREAEDEAQPTSPGRGGTQRKYRKSLTAAEAVALFAKVHQGWPTSRGALDAWTKAMDIATGRITGGTAAHIEVAEGLLRADGDTPPPRHVTVSPRNIRTDAPRPEGLPHRSPKRWEEEDCEEAIVRRYAELRRGVKLTRTLYVTWPPGAHNAPPANKFDEFGGFAKIRDRVAKRLGR